MYCAGGLYTTPTIAGSRSGGLIAQCWASMLAIGEDGYLRHTKDILETTNALAKGVASIPGLRLVGDFIINPIFLLNQI